MFEIEPSQRDLIDSLPAPAWLSGPDPAGVYFNKAWREFTGMRPEEAAERGWADALHPEDLPRHRQAYEQALQAHTPFSVGYRLRHTSGGYRWVLEQGEPRFAAQGEFLGFTGLCTDISDLRRTQEALAASEEEFRSLLTNIPGVVYRCSLQGDWPVDFISPLIKNVSGYPPADFLEKGRGLASLIHPEDRQRVQREIDEQLAQTGSFVTEYRILTAAGKVRWLLASGKLQRTRKGRTRWLSGALFDVTDLKAAEDQLRQAAIVFENTTQGIMITDANCDIIAVNRAFSEIMGYSAKEVLGRNPRLLASGHHGRDFYQAMWDSLQRTGHWRGEIWNRHKQGEIFPLLQTISAVRDIDGSVTGYVAMFSDISHIKQTEARLEQLAYHDALTGLPNRLLFDERLTHAIEQAQRHGERLAVLYFDLDRFKALNDSLGHQVGDELLQAIAARLTMRLRKSDTLSRRGGDEFTVLLENLREPEQAGAVARDILRQLAKPFALPSGQKVHTGTSIGISLYPDDGSDAKTLIKCADAAMYEAKQSGRGQYRYHTQALTRAISLRLELEQRLRQAVETQALRLVYQPLYDLMSGRLVSTEALLRWHDAEHGEVAPETFIPLAEEAGLMPTLGAWALRSACAQAQAWRQAGLPELRMAVNVSSRQLRAADFAAQVREALKATRLTADRLELELSESTLLQLDPPALDALGGLQSLGVAITVDDFGIGYSALRRLQHLPVNRLKIDRSFVRDIPRDPDDMQIVSIIVAMAKALRLEVIAEGVETPEQLRFIQSEHCDVVQGYLLSHPVAPERIPELLRSASCLETYQV